MSEDHDRRATYRLSPPGPVGFLGGPTRLAMAQGTLFGERTGDRVAVWLVHEDRDRTTLMLPGEYMARLDPFELLDERGETVGRGGEVVAVVGGFVAGEDDRAIGQPGAVFYASRVLGTANSGSLPR